MRLDEFFDGVAFAHLSSSHLKVAAARICVTNSLRVRQAEKNDDVSYLTAS